MIKEYTYELSDSTIHRNLDALSLEKNRRILRDVYQRQEGFSNEVDDLFYFFRGFGEYMKAHIIPPKFREKHEIRVSSLEI